MITIRSLLDWGRDAISDLGNYSSNFLSDSAKLSEPAIKAAAEEAQKARQAYRESYDRLLEVLAEQASLEDPRLRLRELLDSFVRRFEECPDAYLDIYTYVVRLRGLNESTLMPAELAAKVEELANAINEYREQRVGAGPNPDSGPLVALAHEIQSGL